MEIINDLPIFYQILILGGFGVIIGSFLNVFLYRFHTGKSLSGHSHCLSCGKSLRFYELIPLFSYLALRGRCYGCRSYIPVRYFIVELLTAVLFVFVFWTSATWFTLLLGLAFVSILIVIAVYDYRHFIIPDELILGLMVLALSQQTYELFRNGDGESFLYKIGTAFLGSLFFFLVWHFSRGKGIGFGDVKLAFPLGLMVAPTGIFSMIVLSFWSGALVGLAILLLQWCFSRGQKYLRFLPGRLTMKSAVPFAPFLIIGFLFVWLCDIDVVSLLIYDF
jgi:leader peptidase (prepilin peptidase) / N-methyltransferase